MFTTRPCNICYTIIVPRPHDRINHTGLKLINRLLELVNKYKTYKIKQEELTDNVYSQTSQNWQKINNLRLRKSTTMKRLHTHTLLSGNRRTQLRCFRAVRFRFPSLETVFSFLGDILANLQLNLGNLSNLTANNNM